MAGCIVAPGDCYPPDYDDEPTEEEQANCELVYDYINSVWNHDWTASEEAQAQADDSYLPSALSASIDRVVSRGYTRHRGEFPEERKKGSGRDEFRRCVRRVYARAGRIHVTVLGCIPRGDLVIALLAIEGRDARADGSTEGKGVLDRPRATGRPFRAVTAVVYRLNGGRIVEDWTIMDSEGMQAQLEGRSVGLTGWPSLGRHRAGPRAEPV